MTDGFWLLAFFCFFWCLGCLLALDYLIQFEFINLLSGLMETGLMERKVTCLMAGLSSILYSVKFQMNFPWALRRILVKSEEAQSLSYCQDSLPFFI